MKLFRHTIPRLFLVLLILGTALTIISPIKANAIGGSMISDGSAAGATGTVLGGPMSARSGVLVYICKTDGTPVSPDVVALTRASAITDRNGNAIPSSNYNLQTRKHSTPSRIKYGVDWAYAFDENGVGRGSAIKKELTDSNASGTTKAYALIAELWGTALADEFLMNSDYNLVIEGFYWNHAYRNDVGTGIWVVATADTYAQLDVLWGQPNGSSNIKRYTHNIYSNCIRLEDNRIGLQVPPHGGHTHSDEQSLYGYGIGVIFPNDDAIHSYWSDHGSPGIPELGTPTNGKKGKCNIIKCYYEKNESTGAKVDHGTFVSLDVIPNIYVDSEPEYEVEKYAVSTSTNTGITSLNFNPPSSISRTGTDPTRLELKGTETTVYILLRKIVDEPVDEEDHNYLIKQSQIARKIWVSEPDNKLSMPNIHEKVFTWYIGQHIEKCPGHTWYCTGCSCNGHSHLQTCVQQCTLLHCPNGGNCTCNGHIEYCLDWDWYKQDLKFSLWNTKKEDYPDILATKEGWNFEVEKGGLAKRYEEEERDSVKAQKYEYDQWDYVCIIHRGKDKLTVAEWKNTELNLIIDAPEGVFFMHKISQINIKKKNEKMRILILMH